MWLTEVANFEEKLCLHFVQCIEKHSSECSTDGAPKAFLTAAAKLADRKTIKIKGETEQNESWELKLSVI